MSKLKIDRLEFGLSPFSSSLSVEEKNLFRNTVEMILMKYLFLTSSERIVPIEWMDVTYLGLSRTLENTLVVDSDGGEEETVVKFAVDGIIFFYDSPNGGRQLPTQQEFLDWIHYEILKPEVLLETLRTAASIDNNGLYMFQHLERVSIWDDFYKVPTHMPSLAPTATATANPSIAPPSSVGPAISPTTATIDSSSNNRFIGTLVGVMLAGVCGLLLLIILGLFCRRRRKLKQNKGIGNEHNRSTTNTTTTITPQKKTRPGGEESPNCKTVCLEDDEESSIQVHEPLDFHNQQQLQQEQRRRFFPPWENNNNINDQSNQSSSTNNYAMEEMSCGSSLFGDEDSSFGNGDFDKQMVRIQPHIVVVREKSFLNEPQRKVACLKKDMLESSVLTKATTSNNPKSILGLPPSSLRNGENTSVLEPTDVSAANLQAISFNHNQNYNHQPHHRLSSQNTGGSGGSNNSSSPTYLVPKAVNTFSSKTAKSLLNEECSSVDEDSNFGGGWDPDDCSSSLASFSDHNNSDSDELFVTKSTNPAEQSLLKHSLRNESYKMQRLRTPDNNNSSSNTSHSIISGYYDDDDGMMWV